MVINIGSFEAKYAPNPFALLYGRVLGMRERERERVKILIYVGAITIALVLFFQLGRFTGLDQLLLAPHGHMDGYSYFLLQAPL